MPTYEVTVSRTERITFQLTAASPQDAEDRYLSDGEETASKTSDLSVLSVLSVISVDDVAPHAD